MVGNRPGLVDRAPSKAPGAPGEVNVGRPRLHALVEDLASQPAVVERVAPVQRSRAVGAEDLARGVVGQRGGTKAAEAIPSAAVDHYSGAVDGVEAPAGVRPLGAKQAWRHRSHSGLVEARPGGGEKAGLEKAVGVDEQHRAAAGGSDRRIVSGRPRQPPVRAPCSAVTADVESVDALSITVTSAPGWAIAAGSECSSRCP